MRLSSRQDTDRRTRPAVLDRIEKKVGKKSFGRFRLEPHMKIRRTLHANAHAAFLRNMSHKFRDRMDHFADVQHWSISLTALF